MQRSSRSDTIMSPFLQRIRQHHKPGLAAAIAVVLLALVLRPVPVQSATFVVDRFDDDASATACTAAANDCSLRGAIIAANANGVDDVITLPAGTYTLSIVGTSETASLDGGLDITSNITINGADKTTTIIDGNSAVTGENVFNTFGFALTLNDLTVQGGQAANGGGISNSGNLTLNNVRVRNNDSTQSGGGILTLSGTVTISGSTFGLNEAGGSGGALAINGGNVTISSTQFLSNTAVSNGGAIWQFSGSLDIDSSSQFSGNAAGSGGALFLQSGGTIEDSAIFNNTAANGGGGLYIAGGTNATLTNTNVNQNDTTGSFSSGGGLLVYGSLAMSGGQVSGNSADGSGGGIAASSGGSVDLAGTLIDSNTVVQSSGYGAGISAFSSTLTLDGVTISNNSNSTDPTHTSTGGGIYSALSTLTIIDSEISGNSTTDDGGGLFFSNGTLSVTNSVFRGNSLTGSTSAGGGLFLGSGTSATLTQIEISANTSANNAGGLHTQGDLILTNATISGNTAIFAAGMLSTGGASDTTGILNTTIYGNIVSSGSLVGGLVAYNDVAITNTIIAGNDNDECLHSSGSSINSGGYNISEDSTCGFTATGDLQDTDPLLGPLADNGGFSKTHEPVAGSPALDAGTNAACPLLDQRGFTRPVDADLDTTAICDIGAVEVQLKLFLPLIAR